MLRFVQIAQFIQELIIGSSELQFVQPIPRHRRDLNRCLLFFHRNAPPPSNYMLYHNIDNYDIISLKYVDSNDSFL